MKKASMTTLALTIAPMSAFAAELTLKGLAKQFVSYLNIALELLMALAIVLFVWYVVKYFIASDKRSEGARYVMWSLIGFFIILSFWGIINILIGTFDLGNSADTWGGIKTLFPK